MIRTGPLGTGRARDETRLQPSRKRAQMWFLFLLVPCGAGEPTVSAALGFNGVRERYTEKEAQKWDQLLSLSVRSW